MRPSRLALPANSSAKATLSRSERSSAMTRAFLPLSMSPESLPPTWCTFVHPFQNSFQSIGSWHFGTRQDRLKNLEDPQAPMKWFASITIQGEEVRSVNFNLIELALAPFRRFSSAIEAPREKILLVRYLIRSL